MTVASRPAVDGGSEAASVGAASVGAESDGASADGDAPAADGDAVAAGSHATATIARMINPDQSRAIRFMDSSSFPDRAAT
jgi:hypothetical protein